MRLPHPLALAALLAAAPLAAQTPPPPEPGAEAAPAQLDPREAARVLREARGEQSRFEQVRRRHLPWAWGGGSGECDERIGRFCLTHSDGPSDWDEEPEAPETVAARDRLLERLAQAAALLPGEPWIAGQRVRYLVEAGRLGEAAEAAAACRADGWWCSALRGFALHAAGEAAPAALAYDAMLRAMPREERRRWTDLSVLLDDCSLREYRRAGEAGREAFERHFWALADPFLGRPGNELRSEHFARHVWDQLQERAKSTEAISWGSDLREILIRYGWPRAWKRIRERPGQMGPPAMVSHYANTEFDLVPPCETLGREGALDRGSWDAEPQRPRTGYALPMPDSGLEWLAPLEHQVALFRRGDSAVVVAAYRLPADRLPPGTRVEADLAVLSRGGAPLVRRFAAGALQDETAAVVPTAPALLSLEVLAADARKAARLRQGIHVPPLTPGLLAVSDLLLLDGPDALPDSLPDARARPSTRLRPGERVGVYWEVYGLSPRQAETLTFSLRLVEDDRSFLRRLARRIGLVERIPPVRLRWSEPSADARTLARSVAIQVPGELAPGSYRVELALSLPGREELVVARAVEVEKG